jgi:hypothetical protein
LSSQAHASPSITKLWSFHAFRAAVIPANSADQALTLAVDKRAGGRHYVAEKK